MPGLKSRNLKSKDMKLLIIFILLNATLAKGKSDSIVSDFSGAGLEELVNAALQSNLRLTPVDLEKKMLHSRIEQVNKQPTPMIEFMLDFLPVTFSHAGEYGVFLNQPIKLFGKTGANEELARQSTLSAEIERKGIEFELVKSVKENYFMLSVNERLIEFNKEFQQILNNISNTLEISYSVGKGSQFEILKSNNELQGLLLEEIELRNINTILVNNLRNLTNLKLPDSFKTKNVEILILVEAPELDTAKLVSWMTENNPELRFKDQRESEVSLEKKIIELERNPDFNLRTGYKYVPEAQASFLQFAIGMDLPFMPWNKTRIDAMVKERTIEQKKIASEKALTEQNLKYELLNQISTIKSTQEKLRYYAKVLIPQTEQTFKASLVTYETAQSDFMNVLDSYRSLREKRQMYIMEQTNYLIFIAELEKLVGQQILTIN